MPLLSLRSVFSVVLVLTAFLLPVRAGVGLPPGAEPCVAWAAGDVEAALRSAGIESASADINVVIVAKQGIEEQSFSISRANALVTVQAGGSAGAMYGLQELAEQIRCQGQPRSWAELAQGLKPTTQTPFVEIRADNAFIHVYPLDLNDLDMWRDYIDMLARNRFNLLDLHGPFEPKTTSFPNGYPLLIHVPEYPTMGNKLEQDRALASFKALIAYAKDRGVKVSFMNYSAGVGKALPSEKLADYTAKAVTRLIRELPDLYMLGFRVGESGQDAAFYKDAYAKGVLDAGRSDLRLYTRSWKTTKEQLEPLAQVARAGLDIEIKFNGEHLGLPYHALQTSYGTYSYQTYLDVPANYQIIWQVRANGTHRFWAWEDTQFVRRTVRTLLLGNARGFTLEPHTAYFSTDPAAYYPAAEDRAVYKYQWQKNWMWYFAWGRLSFDPDLEEGALVRAYSGHFGDAGKTIYSAMQRAGRVVPLVYAYRFMGPDHRDFSPETEVGNQLDKLKDKSSALLQFINHNPEDKRAFIGIGSFVSNKLAGRPDGRVAPPAVAARLRGAAASTRDLVARVPALTGTAAAEWRLLKTDLLSASWLADYYADRIEGLTYLAYALKTGREAEYRTSLKYLEASRQSWKKLGETADAVYGPLHNPLRHQTNYRWGDQLAAIEQLDASAPNLWAAHATNGAALPLAFSAAEQGADAGLGLERLEHSLSAAKDSATISCRATARGGLARLVLWFKPLPSEMPWQSLTMAQRSDGSFSATTPLTAQGLMYLVEVQDKTGQARNFPLVFEETPYRVIPAFVKNP